MQSDRSIVWALEGNDIDFKTGGAQLAWTIDDQEDFMPRQIMLRCYEVSSVISGATISFGTNAATYNNLKAALVVASFSAGMLMTLADIDLPGIILPPVSTIYCNVTVPAVATIYRVRPFLVGVY